MVEISEILCENTVYFSKAVNFFDQFNWMFDFPNTEILTQDVLSKIPQDWNSVFSGMTEEENAQYPENLFTNSSWPDDLRFFTERCKESRLSISKYSCTSPVKHSKALQRGIGPKKMHEISIMSSLINEKCKAKNIKFLVDIGSGVGYLDEILAHDHDFNVLGLDCDQSKIDSALARLTKQNIQPNVEYGDKLKYICTFISSRSILSETRDELPEIVKQCRSIEKTKSEETPNVKMNRKKLNNCKVDKDTTDGAAKMLDKTIPLINKLKDVTEVPKLENLLMLNDSEDVQFKDLAKVLPGDPYCFIGLHTCGDLSVAVIHHFFSLPLARQLIYTPCCYHKLEPHKKSLATTFANFPLSKALRKAYRGSFLRVPFLRLAAQETAVVWSSSSPWEKKEKVFQLLFRSVLQLYAAIENVSLIKKFRRPLKIKLDSALQDTDKLISTGMDSFDLQCTLTLSKVDWNKSLLSQLWKDNVDKTPFIYTILQLQNCLQASAESLILLDRLRFLHESGLTEIELLQIFDEHISPRRYCFVVNK